MNKFVDQYLNASTQYGHLKASWNPKMAPYILHEKHGYHILNLARSAQLLKLAGLALEKKSAKGGSFLFIGTNKVSSLPIRKYALQSSSFYVNFHWLGGMLTNWFTLQKRIERLNLLEDASRQNFPKSFSKKETNSLKKELSKLHTLFDGIKNMQSIPDAAIFACPLENRIAVEECIKLGIPTVAIADTNCNPEFFTYPIPANDDSASSINFILAYLSNKIIAGQKKLIERVELSTV